jgi:hypothetical protein
MMLRTVSLWVPTIPNPVGVVEVVGVWRSGLGIGRLKEMMQLQLMCCALSELPSSQFMRGRKSSLRQERKA